MIYKVFKVSPNIFYGGFSLIGAESAEEANQYIKEMKASDPNNTYDTFGYTYVDSYDEIDDVFTKTKGIVYGGIYYRGN